MDIVGIEGMTVSQLNTEIARGGKFVLFQYCISVIAVTYKNSSKIYFLKGGESRIGKIVMYSVISLIFGWWEIPWGPIYTIWTVIVNLRGGQDITAQVLSALNQ